MRKQNVERWSEKFNTRLNRTQAAQINKPVAKIELNVHTWQIKVSEVKGAVKKIKTGIAPREDELTPQMMKSENTETPEQLCGY